MPGQPFIPEMLEKIRQLRDLKRQQNLRYLDRDRRILQSADLLAI